MSSSIRLVGRKAEAQGDDFRAWAPLARQNTAIGLTGVPVPCGIGSGAMLSMNSTGCAQPPPRPGRGSRRFPIVMRGLLPCRIRRQEILEHPRSPSQTLSTSAACWQSRRMTSELSSYRGAAMAPLPPTTSFHGTKSARPVRRDVASASGGLPEVLPGRPHEFLDHTRVPRGEVSRRSSCPPRAPPGRADRPAGSDAACPPPSQAPHRRLCRPSSRSAG